MDAKFYPTNRLRKGDIVQVVRERPDGWLEIRPPAEAGFHDQLERRGDGAGTVGVDADGLGAAEAR